VQQAEVQQAEVQQAEVQQAEVQQADQIPIIDNSRIITSRHTPRTTGTST
jgi:hypothetical protein